MVYACMPYFVLQCHPVEAIWYFTYTCLLVEEMTLIYFLVSAFKDPSILALIIFLLTLTTVVVL